LSLDLFLGLATSEIDFEITSMFEKYQLQHWN